MSRRLHEAARESVRLAGSAESVRLAGSLWLIYLFLCCYAIIISKRLVKIAIL